LFQFSLSLLQREKEALYIYTHFEPHTCMPVAAFYTFLINAICFNLFFNLALFDCADENLILQLKFVSREIFEKCDWRRSSYEATRRMCNCRWVKKWPESGSLMHWSKLDDRIAPFKLRQPVGFFYTLQK